MVGRSTEGVGTAITANVIRLTKRWMKVIPSMKLATAKFNKRAIECDCQDAANRTISITIGAILSILATSIVLLDRFTSSLAGFSTYRLRILTSVMLLAVLLFIAARIAWLRHGPKTPVIIGVPGVVKHFSYKRSERGGAKMIMLVLLVGLVLSISDLRYLRSYSGPVQGRVVGADNVPIEGVIVDFLDLDKEPVTEGPSITDQTGLFVLDILEGHGRPAFASLQTSSGRCANLMRLSVWHSLNGYENHGNQVRNPPSGLVLRLPCVEK